MKNYYVYREKNNSIYTWLEREKRNTDQASCLNCQGQRLTEKLLIGGWRDFNVQNFKVDGVLYYIFKLRDCNFTIK